MKTIDLSKWPFRALVGVSFFLSALHGLLQLRWVAIRYRSFGPRPLAAKAFIGSEGLLVMVVLTVGMIHICDEESSETKIPYYLGIAAAVGAWMVALFVI